MAAGYSDTTAVTNLIPEITERVDFIFQNKAIGRQVVTYKDVSNQPGLAVEFPIWTEVVASTSVAETATPTSHAMATTMATMTLAKRSVYVLLGDLAKKGMNDADSIGDAMGMAMVKAIDDSVFNVISTTDYATSAGATNAALTITHAIDGLNVLEINEVDAPFHTVVHPFQYKTIRSALIPIANDDGVSVGIADEMNKEALVSRAYGMNWFVTNRVTSRTVDAQSNVRSGLIFNPRGMAHAFSWLEVPGVEKIRDESAADKLLLNWADTSAIIYASAVCTLYSTSS